MAPRRPLPRWFFVGCNMAGILFSIFTFFTVGTLVNSAKQTAQVQACSSNSKKIGMAFSLYLLNNEEYFPPASRWSEATAPYNTDAESEHCPAVRDAQSYGYALNSRLSKRSMNTIEVPSETSLTYDSTNPARNANDALASLSRPGRHNGGNTFTFADGHAQWVRDGFLPLQKEKGREDSRP